MARFKQACGWLGAVYFRLTAQHSGYIYLAKLLQSDLISLGLSWGPGSCLPDSERPPLALPSLPLGRFPKWDAF